MSDSDEDLLPNNVFTFQNDNTTISARGPNVNNTNMTGLSFRNNVLTSTMHMPGNFERQRYGGSNFDQRSMYCRRETSPMSLRSVPDYGAPMFNQSAYHGGMGSQRSMYNGRHRSPMSVRSIDTTTSVSAADIVFAFKNVKFNKYDLQIIKDAYNKLIKTRQRKRIEKRRNLKLFLKGTRRKSGEDSGEQGSDSSISSDDCRSVKTTICKENIPGLKQMKDLSHNSNSTKMRNGMNHMTNVSHFTNNIRENPLFMDRTENIKLNSLRNMIPVNSSLLNFSTKHNTSALQDQNQSTVKAQNISVMMQKERFKKGFQLPSQRFNKSTAGQAQVNNNNKKIKNLEKNNIEQNKPSEDNSGSDQEEIFHGFSVKEQSTQNVQRKRCLETEDNSSKKRNKLNTPKKVSSSDSPEDIENVKCNDFIFAKPKMPIKKGNAKKDHVPEKLLAKSRVPPIAEEINFNFEQSNKKQVEKENNKGIEDTQTDVMHTTSDMSMRPSFIKRKLFTQKLDVAEKKNVSSDSLGINSPQNIYSASMRERNKARKLVTSQSCLSRDVTGEDNNVLDLIHKIVPPDQINNTNIANKTEHTNNRSFEAKNTEKWDVTAVIANCDSQDISDTYTDEEIFNVNHDKKMEESKKSVPKNTKKESQCKVVVQKLQPQMPNNSIKNKGNSNSKLQTKVVGKDTSKKSVTDCVKSFWDTDFESDMEFNVGPRKNNMQQNQETVTKNRNKDLEEKQNSKKITTSKGTILTVRNCHQSILNTSLRSHKTSSEKKCVELGQLNSVVQQNHNSKVDKNNKEINSASYAGKKRNTVKDDVSMNDKSEQVGRKPKVKQCVDCVNENPAKTPKNANKGNGKNVTKISPKNGNIRIKTPLKSKDCKNLAPKQTNQDKVIKSDQKNNAKILKESVNIGRIQPKRKSKEKSLNQSAAVKASNNKARNKISKAKDVVSKNTSLNNTSTIMTRSREKIYFDLSQGDYSSMNLSNLSNLSNRSLRLRQRVNRNIH